MEIKNNTSNVTSFRGNFILAKTLSKGEAELVENFNKIIYKKKNNLQVLKRKSYDIFVKKNDKDPELLELATYYTNYWTKDKTDCFISFIHSDGSRLNSDVASFRSSLKWFENYKSEHAGYNSLFEKIGVGIREFLTQKKRGT